MAQPYTGAQDFESVERTGTNMALGVPPGDPIHRRSSIVTDQSVSRGSDGHGWLTFAGIMVIIVGVLNVIWGIAAIDQSTFFVGETKLVFQDVKTWGWIVLIVGVLEIFAGFGIFARNQAARWFGIIVASLNLIAALVSINAYPTWGLIIVLIDILIIYGLAAHGHKLEDA